MTKRCIACGRFGCQGTCAKAMSKPIPQKASKKHGHADAVMVVMLTTGMALSLSLTGLTSHDSQQPTTNVRKAPTAVTSRATAVRAVPQVRSATQVRVPDQSVSTSLTIVP